MTNSTRRFRKSLFAAIAASAALPGLAAEPIELTFVRKVDPYDRASVLTDRCLQAAKTGDMDLATHLCRSAVQAARKKGDPVELGAAYSNLAAVTWFNGDTVTAKALISKARELAPDLNAISRNLPKIDGEMTIQTAGR